MTDHRVRDVTDADLDAVLTLRNRSFGPLSSGDAQGWWKQVADETLGGRWLCVTDSADRPLVAGRIRPYEQSWGGGLVRMGGVAGVYGEPSARGQGLSRLLMRALVARMTELGDAVSALYPSAVGLYRGGGYEVGGLLQRFTYSTNEIRGQLVGADRAALREATPGDAAVLASLVRSHYRRLGRNGPVAPSPAAFTLALTNPDLVTYLSLDEQGDPSGFVVYAIDGEQISVDAMVAEDQRAAAALWGVATSGASYVKRITVPDRHPGAALFALPEQAHTDTRTWTWMFRVVDLAVAVADRRFPLAVSGRATVHVIDPDAPRADGTWQIEVAGGIGRVVRRHGDASAPDAVRLGPRGLAALYCGTSTAALRAAGLAEGGAPADDAVLDSTFAGTPVMTHYF